MSGVRTLEFVVAQERADQLAAGLSVIEDLVFDRAAAPDGGVNLQREDPSYPIKCILYAQDTAKVARAKAMIEIISELTQQETPEMTEIEVEDQDWVTLTQASLPPVSVGPFYIRGSHSPAAPEGQHDLLIEAGLAFGTGHHETTRGCLELFNRVLAARTPRRVLDMGCGSGVLAMAAAKVAPVEAIGIELDEDSVEVAIINARVNGVAEDITYVHGGVPTLGGGQYDLIFANILAAPLIELAPGLTEVAQPGTDLLLAGLLIEQEADVLKAYEDLGWERADGFHDGQWALLNMRRPS